MAIRNLIAKIRRAILCCRKEETKACMEIGSPTDVRRMDAGEGMPGLSDEDRRLIREKVSNDAIRLLSLQSHPPSQPPSEPSSPPHSREPSHPLLNAASANLPPTLPTPPRQKHNDTLPPSNRMKSVWDRTRRLSTGLQSHHSGYQELDPNSEKATGEDTDVRIEDDVVVKLDLDIDFKDSALNVDLDTPVSAKSGGQFGEQDVMSEANGVPNEDKNLIKARGTSLGVDGDAESTGSEGEGMAGKRLLVQG
ncbi:hypothetical protein BS50DRAFT_638604 [Corynespora cassiicola Philippines]|uniref:Uncharacterized protein n=1 Tax=Corynespora cassiicola Philippines TaxID=1448308 RepID=A0A2T2NAE0_CORCC|nr:hypothetical protein BS50DRAFT_638604 [Corynespora cassiicola Philippines]